MCAACILTNGDIITITPALNENLLSNTIISLSYAFTTYMPEVASPGTTAFKYPMKAKIEGVVTDGVAFKLPGKATASYTLEFYYSSSLVDATYSGSLTVNLNTDVIPDTVTVQYEYDFTGDSTYRESLSFGARVLDFDNDNNTDAVEVTYSNTIANDVGTMYYTMQSHVKIT